MGFSMSFNPHYAEQYGLECAVILDHLLRLDQRARIEFDHAKIMECQLDWLTTEDCQLWMRISDREILEYFYFWDWDTLKDALNGLQAYGIISIKRDEPNRYIWIAFSPEFNI